MIVAFNNKNTWEEDYGKPFYKVQMKVSSPPSLLIGFRSSCI